jgi:broad specificity phosphatase PhoE
MAARSVYICRHGTSEWNLLTKWQGTTDTALAAEGVLQAEKQSTAFIDAGVRFDACVCSDLSRAHTTATILCAPHKISPVVDARLRECSLGEFEGLAKADIFGPKYGHVFARLKALPRDDRIHAAYFQGLETPAQISERVTRCLIDRLQLDDVVSSLLVVTHSTVMESLLAVLFAASFDGIHMRTLAWMRLAFRDDAVEPRFELVEMDGIQFDEGAAPR